jgi:hypothetical protein
VARVENKEGYSKRVTPLEEAQQYAFPHNHDGWIGLRISLTADASPRDKAVLHDTDKIKQGVCYEGSFEVT